MAITGNKGEWSEIYVFLKLLATGRLYAADANLNVLENIYYPILKILREENNSSREYCVNGNIKIYDGNNNICLFDKPVSEFIEKSRLLFQEIKSASGRSFSVPIIEEFLNAIDVHSLCAPSQDKTDIKIVVHDLNTGLTPTLGFSIKSMLGQKSTLFNAGRSTNFIYEVLGLGVSNEIINEINSITETPIIANKIAALESLGAKLNFHDTYSKKFKLNLQMIDSNLPEIISDLLLISYKRGVRKVNGLINEIKLENPLGYDLCFEHPFYEYKIKAFLTDIALGMTPSNLWKGIYDANGGIIIVKSNGDILCYHIYNRNDFQEYLINNTKLEQASTSRHEFGNLYILDNKIYLNLNLQIRFI